LAGDSFLPFPDNQHGFSRRGSAFRVALAAMSEQDKTDQQVEMWKIKKLIKSLSAARG